MNNAARAADSLKRGRILQNEYDIIKDAFLTSSRAKDTLESQTPVNEVELSIATSHTKAYARRMRELESAIRIYASEQFGLVVKGILRDPEYEAFLKSYNEWMLHNEWLTRARRENNPEARHYPDPGPMPIQPPLRLLTAPETMNQIHKRYLASYPRAGSRKRKNRKSRKSRK